MRNFKTVRTPRVEETRKAAAPTATSVCAPTPSTYVRYTYGAGIYGNYAGQSAKGRYFTVTRDLLHEISENCRFVDNAGETTEHQDVRLSTEESQAPF